MAIRFFFENRSLTAEIGLALFLGGMIPLAWSFATLSGVTVLFTVHYGFITGLIPCGTSLTVLSQIAFVFLFYALIYLLDPKVKGVTRPTIPRGRYR